MRIPDSHLYRIGGALLCILGAVALQGCGTKPTRVEADLVSAPNVNDSRPIVVRIYELKTTGSFDGADFYSLYDREGETLGGDLLAREELNLKPGEQRQVQRATAPDAQYIGVVGAYRDIDQARWRATHPLQAGKTNKILVDVGPNAVSIR